MRMHLIVVVLALALLASSLSPAAGQGLSSSSTGGSSAPSYPSGGLCGGTWASPGVCGSPASNNVAASAVAKSSLSKYTNLITIYLTANSFDFLFGAYPGANNVQRALSQGLYNQQLTENGYVGLATGAAANYSCLPCDTVGYITNTTTPYNLSYCTAAGQAAGYCIPNAPFEVSGIIPQNKTWSNDPKHTFYATQYNDNGGAMNGFVWASGKVGAFSMAYYNLTGSYIFQLASNYTLFDNFFQSVYGGILVNHLYAVSSQVYTWNTTASPACPTTINQTYLVNGANVSTVTTGLYPYNYLDVDGVFLPANDNSLFTPDCHVVENVSPFTLGKSPNMPPLDPSTHIGSLLTAAGVSWTWYYQSWNATRNYSVGAKTPAPVSLHENPFTFYSDFSNVNSAYTQQHIKDDDQFFSDLANNVLPQVSWVKPDQSDGFGVTDNNPTVGQAKLQTYMNAIYASRYWQQGKLLVLVTFSDTDGLYDHVPPYTGDSYGPGGRVPTIVISPDHAGGKINSQPYETGSITKLIGTMFNIQTQTDRLFNSARLQSTRDLSNSFTDPVSYVPGKAPALGSSSTGGSRSTTSSSSSTSTSTGAPVPISASSSSSSSGILAPVVSNSGGGSGLSHGDIAGIVIGSVVGGLLLLGLCIGAFLCASRSGNNNKKTLTSSTESSQMSARPSLVNPETSQINNVEMVPSPDVYAARANGAQSVEV